MCRLFGLSSAPRRTRATFWLLDAPDSLSDQSHRDPDGTGLGFFDADGTPQVHKAPVAAYEDRAFAEEARTVESATFVAHIRFASTGALEVRNTHPFEQDGRLFAHNGVIEDLPRLDAHLGPDRSLVEGDTDSERFFALITRETAARGGDVTAGIEAAARWAAQNLPIYALNIILTTADQLWALRYPDTHDLYVLQRPAGGRHGDRHLDHSGTAGRLRVHSTDLAGHGATAVASERMDDHPDWQLMESGELLHVGPDRTTTRRILLPDEPVHRLTLADLHPAAAASQASA
ncbi:class II glutamine amidotransferase [Streptacidiphilus melanogenes]|uniref:class II glutamine amidotransferase n=1 Tax=Streptacidiphilus melanogenes TaxID=411235 RepID=UPI0005AA24A8|nr:class II glutamine amidotransferase [Streptacidiphilus melanogenes]